MSITPLFVTVSVLRPGPTHGSAPTDVQGVSHLQYLSDMAASIDEMVQIREAVKSDQTIIRRMVMREGLDPTSLKWRHFLIAEQNGEIVGIGQVKEYPGCRELGSLVVDKSQRGQGIGSALINALEARAGFPLYLLCLSKMESYYSRFGYQTIPWRQTPWFLKLKLLPTFAFRLFGIRVLVMRKDGD